MPYPDTIPDSVMAEIKQRLAADNGNFVTDTPVGESVYDRSIINSAAASASQLLRLSGFTAKATQNINQVRVVTTGTAAAATPTLCRFGVYQRDQSTNLYTLIASTVNDIALFAATNTTYTKAFSTGFLKTAGQDYAVALLIVSGAALPTFQSPAASGASAAGYSADVLGAFPQISGQLAGQADLPATIAGASVAASTINFHALLLQ